MDSTIFVTNRSTQVSDLEVQQMTAACAKQIRLHVAPAHHTRPVPVVYLDHGAQPPDRQARIITVQNTLDDAEALGYHTQDGSEHIWGVVGTKAAMSQGAEALTGDYSISSILSHEVAEMFIDPFCSGWFDSGDGYLVAYEVGDPVQSDHYLVNGVAVSNFVTAAWFNSLAAPTDRFDHMGHLHGPFTMSKGGYWVQLAEGKTTEKFGEDMPDWLIAAKRSHNSRTSRISRSRPSATANQEENT